MSTAARYQPSEQEVVHACSEILAELPTLGITKILYKLQNEHTWTLSEKRLKSILASSGLRPSNQTNKNSVTDVPSSKLDPLLPIPAGVKAVYFDKIKGKGLVADRDFDRGEVIFVEDAFIAAPPIHAFADVENGKLCTLCFAPLSGSLIVPCGRSDCRARFCNRLCQSRAQAMHHALLCPGQNTSIKPFNRFLSTQKWLSLSIAARTIARILLTHSPYSTPSLSISSTSSTNGPYSKKSQEPPSATLDEMMSHVEAFATVSELERRSRNPGWDVEKESFLSAMKEGFKLLCDGMDPRKARKGKWPLNRSIPETVLESLHTWDTFLRLLGRSNLNTEAQGGMYLVHSHLNHSCDPNVMVTHPPSRAGVRQATKVMMVAKRDIKTGEELFITYQDPNQSLARRRLLLWRDYMFGPCACKRCMAEVNELDKQEREKMEEGSWKVDEQEKEEVQRRKDHAEMVDQQNQKRNMNLKSEGAIGKRDLTGLEEELRSSLGF